MFFVVEDPSVEVSLQQEQHERGNTCSGPELAPRTIPGQPGLVRSGRVATFERPLSPLASGDYSLRG